MHLKATGLCITWTFRFQLLYEGLLLLFWESQTANLTCSLENSTIPHFVLRSSCYLLMELDALLSSWFTSLGIMVDQHLTSVGWRIHEMICPLGVEKQASWCKGNSVKAFPRSWCHCKCCVSRRNRWSKVEWHLGQLSMTRVSGQHGSLECIQNEK